VVAIGPNGQAHLAPTHHHRLRATHGQDAQHGPGLGREGSWSPAEYSTVQAVGVGWGVTAMLYSTCSCTLVAAPAERVADSSVAATEAGGLPADCRCRSTYSVRLIHREGTQPHTGRWFASAGCARDDLEPGTGSLQ
jgi:hypothetical protein